PGGGIVVLADPRGHIAVLTQHLAARAAAARQDAGVTVVPRGYLGYAGERGGMMIAAGDEGRPRRGAQRGRVEGGVPEPFRGQLVQGGRRDAAAERAVLTEARVVDQYEENVRCALRRLHHLRELRRVRLEIGAAHRAREVKIGPREDFGSIAARA